MSPHTSPVLLVWWSADPLIPLQAAAESQRRLDGARRLVVLQGCGHAPHIERAADFAAVLKNALGAGATWPADDRLIGADGKPGKLQGEWWKEPAPGKPATPAGAPPAKGSAKKPLKN